MRQVNLTVSTLANLGQQLEIMLAQTGATLAQMSTLSTEILEQCRLVFVGRGFRWFGVGSTKLGLAGLAVMDIAEEVKIVVEEV